MEYSRFGTKYVVRIDKGEEIVKTLTELCRKENIKLASVTGIGATDDATIGMFDTHTKEYHKTELSRSFEIAPLAGNITTKDGKPYLHLHINLCDDDHNSCGGHLNRAVVSATCEVIIDVIDGSVGREFSGEIGLNLLKF